MTPSVARVAALYDIHANIPALEAVLAEIESIAPDLIVVGGDVVWGPWPQETMDTLRSLTQPVEFLMGNADRDVIDRVEGGWKETNDWCADRLSEEHQTFLRTLPVGFTVDIDGLGPVFFCHGSPRDDEDPITTATSDERIDEMCSSRGEPVIVFGHTHAQFERTVRRWHLVNPGSVGNPFGNPGAYWALLGPDVDLRFTGYDVEATARDARATGFPYADVLAPQLVRPGPASQAAELFTR